MSIAYAQANAGRSTDAGTGTPMAQTQYGLSQQELNLMKYGYDQEFKAMQMQIAAEQQNAATANAFSASEAEKNRAFQQASADKEMAFSAEQAELARLFSRQEAQADRDWQKMMSDTSYQRAVQDLQAAGLNPLLAVAQGGASTPQGAQATPSQAYGAKANGSAATAQKASAAKAQIAQIAAKTLQNVSDRLEREHSIDKQVKYFKEVFDIAAREENWSLEHDIITTILPQLFSLGAIGGTGSSSSAGSSAAMSLYRMLG